MLIFLPSQYSHSGQTSVI